VLLMAGDLGSDAGWAGLVERLARLVDLEATARERGALRRRREVRSAEALLRLAFAYVLGRLSLRVVAAWASERGLAALSDVALLKRLRASADWLGELVAALLAAVCPEAGLGLPGGRRLVAVDATAVAPPGDKRLYWLVHTVFDVAAQRFVAIETSERDEAERLTRGGVSKGEIRLADRGYARAGELAAVAAAEADFIVRVGANHLSLRDADRHKVDRAALCRRAEAGGIQDIVVRVQGKPRTSELQARLIVWALPPLAATTARAKARRDAREWGYTPSASGLVTAGCLMLITSLPAADWPAERVLAAYRLRWQVELAFKRLKSILGLEGLKAKDPDLARCWIHTALLAALLIDLDRPARPQDEPASPPTDEL
jgi:hypothetical protein